MGHNRSGVRHVQRKKRHKREQERLALKAEGEIIDHCIVCTGSGGIR